MKGDQMSKSLKDLKRGRYRYLGNGLFEYVPVDGETRYGIQYTKNGRTVREIVGPFKTLAKEKLRKKLWELDRERHGLPTEEVTPESPTFEEYASTYKQHHSNEDVKRSWKRDKLSLKNLEPFFGSKPINEIKSDDVSRYRSWRAKSVSGSTVNRELALLRHMFNQAIAAGLMTHNPVQGIQSFRENGDKCWHVVTPAEEAKLTQEAADHLKPLITVALETGMRLGELLALDWHHVSVKDRLIHVVTSTSGDTKSGKARWVPITDRAYVALRSLDPKPAGPVFTHHGKPIMRVTTAWRRACREAGVKARFHDLRHTACTRLIAAGVPVPQVQLIAGHASITTTMKYVHLDPRQTDNVRAAMAAYHQEHDSTSKKCLKSVRREKSGS
jgi:integrase